MHVFSALSRLNDFWSLRSYTEKQKQDAMLWEQKAKAVGLFSNINSLDKKYIICGMAISQIVTTAGALTFSCVMDLIRRKISKLPATGHGDGPIRKASSPKRSGLFFLPARRRN